MRPYNHKQIDKKWQKKWEEQKLYEAKEDRSKKKSYLLVEFPYPSGAGLHVGHPRPYIGLDVIARKRRMQGESVLYPFGWDAFGLPTENYAVKTGIHPRIVTKQNTDRFREQVKALGISFDWSREINTTDPKYYKWTQWIFLKLYKKGLAYKAKMPINWCLSCKIGLANEEVIDGKCERCGGETEKREKEQWMLAITKYADRLYDDLDTVDYVPAIKLQQRNWIGPSTGAIVAFPLRCSRTNAEGTRKNAEGEQSKYTEDAEIEVFTTRIDTLYGATYLVLSPEHLWIEQEIRNPKSEILNKSQIEKYIKEARKKTEIERTAEGKEKTGVEIKGIKAINPGSGEEIPVFVADYVLAHYGTGAIMAVPAHDERDFAFAKKFDLPIKRVVAPETGVKRNDEKEVYGGCGILFDPKTQRYAVLQRTAKNDRMYRLCAGGVSPEEDLQAGICREIEEESGYHNFKHIEDIGCAYTHFYNRIKKKNHAGWATCLLCVLKNGSNKGQRLEDHEDYEVVWTTPGEIISNWEKYNDEKDLDHWLTFLETAVARAIELGYDTKSDASKFAHAPFTGEGRIMNSDAFDGLRSEEAKEKIAQKIQAVKRTTYKLRDWVFSRQRYWGEPIPLVWCEKDGWVPVPEEELPVELPEMEKFQPTDSGESPLATLSDWVNTTCPACGGPAKRETDTMPNWAGSSWYYLRYTDPHNDEAFAGEDKLKYWTPVDWYNGGMEHTTLHLLYSRFWHKVLYDEGLVPTSEPYQKRTSHGIILAEGGEKMSKSKGNVVNPDEVVDRVGADAFRMYEMFMGPFDQAIAWSADNMVGSRRFLDRVWKLKEKISERKNHNLDVLLHKTIKKVGDDIEELKFNTAVSQLMIFVNACEREDSVDPKTLETLLRLIAPFAPHLAEEIWYEMGHSTSIHRESWPAYNSSLLSSETVMIAVQVNGKVRASFEVSADESDEKLKKKALSEPPVIKWVGGKEVQRVIVVPGRLINIVTSA